MVAACASLVNAVLRASTAAAIRQEIACTGRPGSVLSAPSNAVATLARAIRKGAAGRAAANGIAGSTLIEYDGAPHGLFATHKERFTTDLLDFLQR